MKKLLLFYLIPAFFLAGCGGGDFESNLSPRVTVSASPTSGNLPLVVTFSVRAFDQDGSIQKIEADLDGDGVFDVDITGLDNIAFIYTVSGLYVPAFKATDDDGNTGTATIEIIAADGGDVVQTLSFPSSVTVIHDIFFDSDMEDYWALGENSGGLGIFRLDASSGSIVETIPLTNPIFSLNGLNELTLVSGIFWITTGFPAASIYKVDSSGWFMGGIPCPSTATGVCKGIAWDGASLWSGASDNTDMSRFSLIGTIQSVLAAPGIVEDIGYDSAQEHLLVTTSAFQNLYRIEPATGGIVDIIPVGGLKKGTWDGRLFWFVDNASRQLMGVFIN